MISSKNKQDYPTARLRLANGLTGIVALSDSAGHVFSKDDWAKCLSEPDKLESNPAQVLKREGSDSVIVKTINVGSRQMDVVVKTRLDKNFVRYLRVNKALRNFRTAVLLKKMGIAAEIPLAALRQKKDIFTDKSIYITEYVPQNTGLHWFVKKDLATLPNQPAIKKHLARELAQILAGLDENGLWHRDAKPSNFLVRKEDNGQYKLVLIDLDGVKPYYGLQTFSRRFRSFAHLAALRLVSPLVYTTDCLRTFNIYCNLTGLNKPERKQLFRRIVKGPAAKRLRKLSSEGKVKK